MEKKVIEKLSELFFYVQYGRLMPGMIHNINGKITAVDSKLQLNSMKMQMKIKKLNAKKNEMPEEEFETKLAGYEDTLKMLEQIKQPMKDLNSLMKVLNDKTFNENTPGIQMIDINDSVRSFCEFFKFYKYFKHNVETELELEGNPFIKMEYRDLFFMLYAVTRNAVDSTLSKEGESIIRFKTENHDNHVVLTIRANGELIKDEANLFKPLYTTKKEIFSGSEEKGPEGMGLNLYFLKKVLDKYKGYDYSLQNIESGTEFKIILLKK